MQITIVSLFPLKEIPYILFIPESKYFLTENLEHEEELNVF